MSKIPLANQQVVIVDKPKFQTTKSKSPKRNIKEVTFGKKSSATNLIPKNKSKFFLSVNQTTYQQANKELEKQLANQQNSRNTKSKLKENTFSSSVKKIQETTAESNIKPSKTRNTLNQPFLQFKTSDAGISLNTNTNEHQKKKLDEVLVKHKEASKDRLEKPIYYGTLNKVTEKLINNLKTKYEKEIQDRRYPLYRIREDLNKILNAETSLNICWGNLNTLKVKTESGFERIINQFKPNTGVVDMSKIGSIMSWEFNSKKEKGIIGVGSKIESPVKLVDGAPKSENERKIEHTDIKSQTPQKSTTPQKQINNRISPSPSIRPPSENNTNNQNIQKSQSQNQIFVENPNINPPENQLQSLQTNDQKRADKPPVFPKSASNKDQTLKEKLKSKAYNNLITQKIEKNLKLQEEIRKQEELMKAKTELEEKHEQERKTRKQIEKRELKESLDLQVKEKQESRNRNKSEKKEFDNKIVLSYQAELTEKNDQKQNLSLEKKKTFAVLLEFENQKKEKLRETKEKEKKIEDDIRNYQATVENKIKEKEDQKKLEAQRHWNEFHTNNQLIKEQKQKRKLEEKEESKKNLVEYDQLLKRQELSRNKDREKLMYKMNNSYSASYGIELEREKMMKLKLEEEKIKLAAIEIQRKQDEMESHKKQLKLKKLDSFKDGLSKQVEHKKQKSLEKEIEDKKYFTSVVLKNKIEFNEDKKKVMREFLEKRENYKKDLDEQKNLNSLI